MMTLQRSTTNLAAEGELEPFATNSAVVMADDKQATKSVAVAGRTDVNDRSTHAAKRARLTARIAG